ncbi:MAG: ATPase, T2SS/T4P/T4SS family, partial [Anaeroplasmataceae bacterium]
DRTTALSVDLSSSEGVKTSWLNPLDDGTCDLRVTCSATRGGLTCVTRIQTIATTSKTVETLGLSGHVTEYLKELSLKENGLTLVTGPVRSGKNTTVNAMINDIINSPLKIVEYSSPIETSQPFEQYDYNDDRTRLLNFINLSKKQDINIAVINELPRKEVADAVYDLVNSSIGVMTTFHINRIWDLPYKLKNYFGEDFIDLITKINGVVNQKMFVKQCSHCLEDKFSTKLPKSILSFLETHDIKTYKESRGCIQCNGTGRANQVQPFAEYLKFNKELKSRLLRCNHCYEMEELIYEHVTSSHTSLDYPIAEAVRSGVLHPLDVIKLE